MMNYEVIELKEPIPSSNPGQKVRSNCYQVDDGFEIARLGNYFYIRHLRGTKVSEVPESNVRRAVPMASWDEIFDDKPKKKVA